MAHIGQVASAGLANSSEHLVPFNSAVGAGTLLVAVLTVSQSTSETFVADSQGNPWVIHTQENDSGGNTLAAILASVVVENPLTTADDLIVTRDGGEFIGRCAAVVEAFDDPVSGVDQVAWDAQPTNSSWATGTTGTLASQPQLVVAGRHSTNTNLSSHNMQAAGSPVDTSGVVGSAVRVAQALWSYVAATTAVSGSGTLSSSARSNGTIATFPIVEPPSGLGYHLAEWDGSQLVPLTVEVET